MFRLEPARFPSSWWKTPLQIVDLSTGFGGIRGIASDTSARKLFVVSSGLPHGNLVRYARSGQSFTPFLPAIGATSVDFARESDWITYVRPGYDTLWISRSNGNEARQISSAGMTVELPRWSPDNKQIAFMGKVPNGPWRIYLVPAMGGTLKEASKGGDNQGAPTWSPDGKYLAYGNVECQQERTCAIHTISLTTGMVETLPHSQGLATARWSPDGKYVAALDPERHELFVYSVASQEWRKVAESTNGNDLSWSADSQAIYTNRSTGNGTEILRVPMAGGMVQTVLNLASLSKSTDQLDTWFCVAPDGTIIVHRLLNNSEIFALSYRVR